ncbi:nitrate reductase [Wolfiporia cocos MD-104 SS10]|uniref:Nitrate reductase n=1 Tax=Wolfiporia cocos (strain MD-104) TaxID=742152 RepID=A0A2H3JAN9_WOLCO|nr:nitrate reductase [Wolfiporia cocos MD-104 SS10]
MSSSDTDSYCSTEDYISSITSSASIADAQEFDPPKSYPPIPQDQTPDSPAAVDQSTPDGWINRNPELLRLTGRHPFNCEAPLTSLFDAGFLTPPHLHFVRNHGAVPRIDQHQSRDWTIRVHGLVERECTFSLQDLQDEFQVVTLPVTLVCAGNRRKEQNIVRRSLGFDWGAAGLSTALWTGVYLADILHFVRPQKGEARHVIFEGADDLPNGSYGTSQRLSWATSYERGMLIAWAMNGLALSPDHGFPVRLIVPGQIGGRSVKWLKRIEISASESQHHLHFFDNKVLPTQLTPERARVEKFWWYDPLYLITELSVNSAVVKPEHGELCDLIIEKDRVYTIQGYAYSGGGRRINRVEVSLDNGLSWSLATIEYPEDKYRTVPYEDSAFGTLDLTERDTNFCWCFWTFQVPVSDLARSSSIAVRATDEAMNTQPRDMYPNATGMLNNWWFRVAIVQSTSSIRFMHPAPVGDSTPGWMEAMKASGQDPLNPSFADSQSYCQESDTTRDVNKDGLEEKVVTKRIILRSELETQDRSKPWFVVNGEIYDATSYLDDHPGGADSIRLLAGQDATDDFMAIHSTDAKRQLQQFYIGTFDNSDTHSSKSAIRSPLGPTHFLSPREWKRVILSEMRMLNHNSLWLRFALPGSQQTLGLPVGQHVFVRLRRKDTGDMVQRAYTPVSVQDAVGFVDFIVKLYLPCSQYPVGGRMSAGLNQLQLGDMIELKGPLGSFVWKGRGQLLWKDVSCKIAKLIMICGGSGITPMLQILRNTLNDVFDDSKIWLLYANSTEGDILCKAELDELQARHEGRFHIHHALSKSEANHGSGRITTSTLTAHLPPPSSDALVLTCGPPAMISEAVKPGLKQCGWDTEKALVIF